MVSQNGSGANSSPAGRGKGQQIEFLIERQTGIPSVEHLAGLSEEERDQLITNDAIVLRNDLYAEFESLPDQLIGPLGSGPP